MMRPFLLFGAVFSVAGSMLIALVSTGLAQQEMPSATRADFVSDASFVVGTYSPTKPDHSPAAMADAANAFLKSLDANQRGKCKGKLKSPQRREWTNLPARRNADGVRMGDLKPDQIKLACDLMANLLSEQGYNRMTNIMLADDQLLKGGRSRNGFGTENFSIVVFGTPSKTQPWGFQLDGHHVGANISIQGEQVTLSPSFIGTQPAAFRIARTEYQPFKNETGLAHELAMSLNGDQVFQAVQSPKRARIQSGPGRDKVVPQLDGVDCSSFSDSQKKLLFSLIRQWVGDLPKAQAAKRMQQLEKEIDQMKFGWNGNRNPKSDVSYTIQSPSLIIEYACQDLGGNPLDHLHSNYRDPTNEYGGQLD
jgi:hypothetical protein